MSRNFKIVLIVLVILIAMASADAFAATDTVSTTKIHDSLGVVSGYTVTAITYTLNTIDPSTLANVSFDMGSVAAKVEVQLVSVTGSWYPCTLDTGTVWKCDITGLRISAIDQLRVVSASN